jgi:hypothetical protein
MFNGFLTPMGGNTSKALVNVFLHELKGRKKKIENRCKPQARFTQRLREKLLVSFKENFEVIVGDSTVCADPEICLLGIDYNTNFATSTYLQRLATEA